MRARLGFSVRHRRASIEVGPIGPLMTGPHGAQETTRRWAIGCGLRVNSLHDAELHIKQKNQPVSGSEFLSLTVVNAHPG